MPGSKNIFIGVLWVFGGFFITVMTYAEAMEGSYVLAFGVLLIGLVQLSFGLVQYFGYQMKDKATKEKVHAEVSSRAIVRAMLATAITDGKIKEHKVERIATAYEQIFGDTLESSWIRETAAQMIKAKFDIYKAIRDEKALIDPELYALILKAAYFIASADGVIDDTESKILSQISDALELDDSTIKNILAELQLIHPIP